MKKIRIFIQYTLLFVILSCKGLKFTKSLKDNNKEIFKAEELIFQTDACDNKVYIKNITILRKWYNDSIYFQKSPLTNGIDTFLLFKNSSFKMKMGNAELIIYKKSLNGDSILAWNEKFSAPIQLLDSIFIDRQEKVYVLRQYATSILENSFTHPMEFEYLFIPGDGIIGYRHTAGDDRCQVFRLVKKITYIKDKSDIKYYNFDLPKSWHFDLLYKDPRQ